MKRRHFLFGVAALGLIGCGSSKVEAAPFQPTRFSVQVKGSGPDVILIPGLTAGRDVWSSTVAALPGYRYHLVQVAGFAGEPARGNAKGKVVAPVADEIGRYIEARGLKRPAIVGHSMGGTIAMMIGARRPGSVGKIMVVDMLPQPAGLLGSSASNLGPLANSLRDLVAMPGGKRLFESVIGNFGGARGNNRSDSDVVGRAMHELATTDLTPELGRIAAPMTVLYAALDAQDAPRATRVYSAGYAGRKGTKLVRVDNSGHMIMQEQPARFRAEFRKFLTS